MSTFVSNCPHCGTNYVAFSIVHEVRAHKIANNLWDTIAICGQCSRAVLATFFPPDNHMTPRQWLATHRRQELPHPQISPSLPDSGAPKHTPGNVSRFYEQGMENMLGNWDAAGSMFRKALDAGLKAKFPDIKGTLYARIVEAGSQNRLTPELEEWSHQIRLDGNDAAHDEEPFSKEDAERLQAFTHLVLLYLFNLPGMLDQARGAQIGEVPAGAATAE